MQTPAEKFLVNQCVSLLSTRHENEKQKIINIGAGNSLSIEKQLDIFGAEYICDRVDLEDCRVEYPTTKNCYYSSVESMPMIQNNTYVIGFANFLLEHVRYLEKAANNIYRILKPNGHFIATVPNPTSLEMSLAKITPLSFHKIVRGRSAWETYYSYSDINDLIRIFEEAGFQLFDLKYYSFIEGYLYRFPIINVLGKLYDNIISKLQIRRFMGQACVVFTKPLR